MTNENNTIQTVEVKRINFWETEGFKKFLTTALATFVGVFCALTLFAALHKPPMKPCHMGPHHMKHPAMYHRYDGYNHHHRFDRGPRGDFHRKFERRDFKRFERKDFDKSVPVRVNVETEK